jgi:hypothetical protein
MQASAPPSFPLLFPPSLFPAPAAAAPTHDPLSIEHSLQSVAGKLQKETQRSVLAQAVMMEEPTTPTEEALEQMEADEMIAQATAEKARTRFIAKARKHEELRVRLAHARRKMEKAKAKQKEERMRHLMHEKRTAAALLARQVSED